jgi:hypothetical protein
MNSRSLLEGRVTQFFGIFMIFVYAALGVLLLCVTDFWQDIPKTYRTALGIVLIVYAGFRTYMLFKLRAGMKKNNP